MYEQLSTVYQTYAPSLTRAYEDSATQAAILTQLGQMAIESGYFKDMVAGQMEVEVTYTVNQFLFNLGRRSAQEGSLQILGQELRGDSKQQLTQLRQNIGYIFQATTC